MTVDGLPTLRTIYPSVASQASCVECHNRLQPQATPWHLGEVMGAFAVDRPADHLLTQSLRESVFVCLAVFVAATSICYSVPLLHPRRVRRDIYPHPPLERERLLTDPTRNAKSSTPAYSS